MIEVLKQALEALEKERPYLGAMPTLTSKAITSLQQAIAKLESQEPVAIDGNTSDGYHTFNELYEFRKAYNIALFNEWSSSGKCSVHKSWRHHDGELCFGGGWFIVVAVLPNGQISNHYEAKDWGLFQIKETEKALFEFDGHTGQDVINRLSSYTHPPQRTEQEPVAHSVIAGVLFDFMGWLTSRKERIVLSSADNASPAVEAITEFARMRNLSLDDAKVQDWHTHPPQRTEQEPVSTLWQHGETGRFRVTTPDSITDCDARWFKVGDLYLHPPQRTWVGLTDEDIWDVFGGRIGTSNSDVNHIRLLADARKLEAKLKQKNGFAEEKNT
jgi:hypothetical protein